MTLFRFTLFLAAIISGFGIRCAGQESPAPEKAQTHSAASTVAYTNSMGVLDDKKKIVVGDRLSFRVVEDRKPPISLMVTDSGEIEVPLIGRVNALNKTCKQLAYEIKKPLEKDYFFTATVIVGLDELSMKSLGTVYVTGNVRSPGPLVIPPEENFTVSRAILRAGGFDQFANRHRVKLIRKKADNPNETETTVLDVGDIIEHGRADKDMTVAPDDMIVVPRNLINY